MELKNLWASCANIYLDGGKDLSLILNRVVRAGGVILVPKTNLGDKAGYVGREDSIEATCHLQLMKHNAPKNFLVKFSPPVHIGYRYFDPVGQSLHELNIT